METQLERAHALINEIVNHQTQSEAIVLDEALCAAQDQALELNEDPMEGLIDRLRVVRDSSWRFVEQNERLRPPE